jgi:hypothetical protein
MCVCVGAHVIFCDGIVCVRSLCAVSDAFNEQMSFLAMDRDDSDVLWTSTAIGSITQITRSTGAGGGGWAWEGGSHAHWTCVRECRMFTRSQAQ